MNYNFPRIENISDVLPAIEGREEFIVAERPFGTVINYMVNMPDTFDINEDDLMANHGRAIPKGIMRRECRGIIFDKTGAIMSRPFHKFFNVGERDETLVHNLELEMKFDHVIMEKMDGSMIRPLYMDGKLRLGTEMGVTDVSLNAENCLIDMAGVSPAEWHMATLGKVSNKHLEWLSNMSLIGFTPLFEYVSPGNQIVLSYEKSELVLLAVRNNFTGEYLDIEEFRDNGLFPVVETYGSVSMNLDKYIERQRQAEEREGDIIRFANGHMLKVKNDWYCRIHKAMDRVRFDRNIVDLIVNENMDDVVPLMPEKEITRLREFEQKFWNAFKEKENQLYGLRLTAQQSFEDDKKRVALEMVPRLDNKTDGMFIFKMLDGHDLRELLLSHIQRSISSNVKWDACADWMGMTNA